MQEELHVRCVMFHKFTTLTDSSLGAVVQRNLVSVIRLCSSNHRIIYRFQGFKKISYGSLRFLCSSFHIFYMNITKCSLNLFILSPELATVKKGTPLYGQPSWWGEGEGDAAASSSSSTDGRTFHIHLPALAYPEPE